MQLVRSMQFVQILRYLKFKIGNQFKTTIRIQFTESYNIKFLIKSVPRILIQIN